MQEWNQDKMSYDTGTGHSYTAGNPNMHNNYENRQPEDFRGEEDHNFIDHEDDEALYSNDEEEFDQSFDDSDIQNKDPGILLAIYINRGYSKSTQRTQ